MVGLEKVERLLDSLRDNLADLKRYRRRLVDGTLGRDRDVRHMVLHAMYVTIQSAIDVSNHLLAARGLARATTYASIFERLAEGDVLDRDLAERLADWASMRNVLAHLYPIVDYDRVERTLRDDLGDFDEFLVAVEALLTPSDDER